LIFSVSYYRNRVVHNEIVSIGMLLSFITLLLHLSVNATLLQAVFILLVKSVDGIVVEDRSVYPTDAGLNRSSD